MLPSHGAPRPDSHAAPVRRHRLARQAIAFIAGLGISTLAVVISTPVASAANAAASSHDPVGVITSAKAANGSLQLTGWAYDPDVPATNLTVVVAVDGHTRAVSATTSLPNAAVTKKYGTGPTPGYALTMPLPAGNHTLCVLGHDLGPGVSAPVGCIALPLGRKLTTAQTAAQRPSGAITSATAPNSSTLTYAGYVTDPDWFNAHLRVVLYVDGAPAATRYTSGTSTGGGSALNSAFRISVPVSRGTHVACIWVVNIGLGGGNTWLGCKPVDTGTALAPSSTAPALNKAVMAEALKHKGADYVWAAGGPKTFDCSGLVMYSYNPAINGNKTGIAAAKGRPTLSLPHQSGQQALLAHLIPASRALPGDLVFYFDNEGDVYHVGLYTKPGQDFAAIDTQEGVNYQTIWQPSMVMYASFTHS